MSLNKIYLFISSFRFYPFYSLNSFLYFILMVCTTLFIISNIPILWLYDMYICVCVRAYWSYYLCIIFHVFWLITPSLFVCACLRKHNSCRLSVDDSNWVRNVSMVFYIVLNNFMVAKTIGSIVPFCKLF